MAITGIGNSTGTYAPAMTYQQQDKSSYTTHNNGRILHTIDLNYQKVDPNDYIKWCRRNLGDRHDGWDFWMAGKILYIEVWGDKQKFTYEMWKN